MTSLSYPNKLSLIYSHSLFDTGFDGLFELVYGIYDMAHCTTKKNNNNKLIRTYPCVYTYMEK